MNKISISTFNGASKLIYNDMVLKYMTEEELSALSFDIWVALQEMGLAKEMAEKYEAVS